MTGSRHTPLRAPLSETDRRCIAEAIARAEAATSGEIVVMLCARAGLYRSLAPALALLGALCVPWPLIAFTALSASSIALVQVGVALAILLATFDERVRLWIMPRAIRRGRVREAAMREFRTRGLAATRARTGVLLYVSLAERHAEIVADTGIAVPPGTWHGVVADLSSAAGRGTLGAGLAAAVERVGVILATDLPAAPGDGDELPNRVIVSD
ncbi:hypothetical protein ASG40_04965 [Methylobacterium sp. Leaf399]|uniref:TPM domain-containing protein n=1 Tax=unclassified Methylobacterium TaxID=2615210 RepID=UPI0006F46059|nr:MULTISPECIES: hypothetical protein [unclassified Methylobacterium]KQT14667.1 hypothetical protein ASG40_04965 [Methylobacterium sp. Leaf399]KQT90599.1 hypothetical protein ASG59_00545 [Methylobacterium sp. Leaf466]